MAAIFQTNERRFIDNTFQQICLARGKSGFVGGNKRKSPATSSCRDEGSKLFEIYKSSPSSGEL